MESINLKLEDWVDFTKETSPQGLTSVLLTKKLNSKLIEWSDTHTSSNQINTRLERFSKNPELARTQRSYFFCQALKTAISISASEGVKGSYQYNYNCETDTGKIDTSIKLTIVNLHGQNGYTLLIE